MNDLRKAAQQAIEALELPCDRWNATQYRIVTDAAKTLRAALAQEPAQPEDIISLPRELDEDLYYIVGSAMGAQSPEQCGRADRLWKQLVARADWDKKQSITASSASTTASKASQPAKRLTDEQIRDLADCCTPNTETGSLNYREFARAIEAAVLGETP